MPKIRTFLGLKSKLYYRQFYAVSEVSFDIKKGETVGIIGRNGAGKSTLLQMISGTLTPTVGEIEVSGRVAALLELGSGFNIEFTGRENIYMYASVLGLTQTEIEACFNDIVAFAEIGDFLDQPVKTYSSGMYVRLAFAVVAHVNASILIVDEALSVGDMYFQAKCMAHMKKMMQSGVTVLFVSHDTNAVKALCERAIYLEQGQIVAIGATDDVVNAYYGAGVISAQELMPRSKLADLSASIQFSQQALDRQLIFSKKAAFHRVQNGMVEILDAYLVDDEGELIETINFGQRVTLKVLFKSNTDIGVICSAYHIRDKNGFDVVYSDTAIEDAHIQHLLTGDVVCVDWQFTIYLREGDYSVATMLSIPQEMSIGKVEVCDFVPLAVNFKVSRNKMLPIYGAVYWQNKVSQYRKIEL